MISSAAIIICRQAVEVYELNELIKDQFSPMQACHL